MFALFEFILIFDKWGCRRVENFEVMFFTRVNLDITDELLHNVALGIMACKMCSNFQAFKYVEHVQNSCDLETTWKLFGKSCFQA